MNDSLQQWAAFKPAPADGPAGAYQFTPNQTFALYPQLANATTFATPTAAPVPSQQFGATVKSRTRPPRVHVAHLSVTYVAHATLPL